ncbi:MAG: hypothetical protein KF914_15350 [Rhizobiaceae bacterium]|nr:hypothetical protein [Rhizobiaceae bacterium]
MAVVKFVAPVSFRDELVWKKARGAHWSNSPPKGNMSGLRVVNAGPPPLPRIAPFCNRT